MSQHRPGVTLIIPARNRQDRIGSVVNDWFDHRYQHCTVTQIFVVDDGSTDDTPNVVTRLQPRHAGLQLISHATPQGFGASLRDHALTQEYVAYLSLDYPYRPADLDLLMERAGKPIDVFGSEQPIAVVNGCRTGVPIPAFWRFFGRVYRIGMRVALGHKPEPLAGWLGCRNHCRPWWLWLTMGIPTVDITSGLKVFRSDLFERFPIQSAGDFVHAELLAKSTFLGALIAEVPLPPRSAAIPPTEFGEFWTVFRDARFRAVETQNPPVATGGP